MCSSPFGLTRDAYLRYRAPYPSALWTTLDAARSGPAVLAVDLGAGTGLSTGPLLDRFEQVVAIDSSEPLEASLAGSPRVEMRRQRAEEALFAPGSVDLVVVGNALHWMDVDRVLESVRGWLRPGGMLAAWRTEFPTHDGPTTRLLLAEMAERWDGWRHPRLRTPSWTERAVGAAAPWSSIATHRLETELVAKPEELVGLLSTVSYVSAYAESTGDAAGYLRELRGRLGATSDAEETSVLVPTELVLATV